MTLLEAMGLGVRHGDHVILHGVNFAIRKGEIVLVSDEEMEQAARSLWFEFGIAADLSGAAAAAALQSKRFVPAPGSKVCALVCGAGTDGTGA